MTVDRIELIKAAAKKAAAKKLGISLEEYEFQLTIKKLDARKAKIKAAEKARKKEEAKIAKDLTGQVKKAGHLSSGGLDLNREENMYWSERETQDWFESSSLMDAYNANKFADGDWD
tara:strand:- start:14629 stop:14979 length:351 start_codon:yes stop_codon:yes gene_type:complete